MLISEIKIMKYVDERCEAAKRTGSDYSSTIHKGSSDRIDTNIGGIDDVGRVLSDLTQAVSDLAEQVSSLSESVEGKEK